MKRLPIATFCAFLLMATSMSLPSAIEAKKLRWSNILESKSGIVIDIDGYKFQHRGTGWNAEYSRQMFSATTYNFDQPLYVSLLTDVLAEGYVWSNTNNSLESYIQSSFRFRNFFRSFVSRWGSSKDGSHDSDQGFAAAKFTLSHPTLNTCYLIRYAPHFGSAYRESFNPYISLQLCSKGDLNLELSDAKNIFSIDERNKTVGLNFSYQNLAQKIAALKKPIPSTAKSKVEVTPKTIVPDSSTTNVREGSLTDRLKALKKLEDAGLISKEEAAEKRKEILKNL